MALGWMAAAIGLVLLIVLIWMNARFLRNQTQNSADSESHSPAQASEPTMRFAAQGPVESQDLSVKASQSKDVSPSLETQNVGSPSNVADDDVSSTPPEQVEVIHATPPGIRLFERSEYPFRLYDTTVPMFSDADWKRSFTRLTEDPQVLGWIAFQDDLVGAADREYESGFLEVLRTYRRTVERLRQEIGLSHIQETSVVGQEGKVWFLTAVDGAWLALFLDTNVDAKKLADRLLGPVRPES